MAGGRGSSGSAACIPSGSIRLSGFSSPNSNLFSGTTWLTTLDCSSYPSEGPLLHVHGHRPPFDPFQRRSFACDKLFRRQLLRTELTSHVNDPAPAHFFPFAFIVWHACSSMHSTLLLGPTTCLIRRFCPTKVSRRSALPEEPSQRCDQNVT